MRNKVAFTDAEVRAAIADGTIARISRKDREIRAVTLDGRDITDYIMYMTRWRAESHKVGLVCRHTKTGGVQWRHIANTDIEKSATKVTKATKVEPAATAVSLAQPHPKEQALSTWEPMTDDQIRDFVSTAIQHKPEDLVIPEVHWKFLVRAALRGENIMIVGSQGSGKTLAAQTLGRMFKGRPFAQFTFGASQDPRGMLIGNVHFNKEDGTFFAEALFARMIQTPGAVILLDELSRDTSGEASNILMSVLDPNQRYLRIDEKPDTPTIPVAPGVTFLATANVGNEFTGTRIMDRALLDRFTIIEMPPLSKESEATLLKRMYPNVEAKQIEAIAEIAAHTRDQVRSEEPKVSTTISTRVSVKIAANIADGFTLAEAAEVLIYPFFSPAGGADSERTYVKQLVQKYLPTAFDDKNKPWDKDAEQKQDDSAGKVPW